MKRNKQSFTQDPIVCDVIRVFATGPIDSYNRWDLRVVKWSGGTERVLEKRRVWNLKDGTLRNRKLMGFTLADLEFIIEHAEEIKKELRDEK